MPCVPATRAVFCLKFYVATEREVRVNNIRTIRIFLWHWRGAGGIWFLTKVSLSSRTKCRNEHILLATDVYVCVCVCVSVCVSVCMCVCVYV
jgi:hypothetical protein